MKLENQNILIFSNEPWGDIWYSKHNWAFELAKKNKVFFINPPKRWSLKKIFEISIMPYSENLKILYYNNLLPFTRFGWIYQINNYITSKRLKKFLYKNNFKEFIFWTFDPYRFTNPKLFSPKLAIYFIADKYNIKREKELIKNTDFFITISKTLTDNLNLNKLLVLSHGISSSEFRVEEEVSIEEGYAIFVGQIDYKLDYEFILKIVEEFPNKQFLFIGPLQHNLSNQNFKRLFIDKAYSNVIHLPPIHFKKLKNYIAKAKVCLAPILLHLYENNINSHKLLQYLALGKPVLAPTFKDYENNTLIFSYSSPEDGIAILHKIFNFREDPSILDKRIHFAKQFTYENLITKVEQFLNIK
mgnify:CR=1 FL=1